MPVLPEELKNKLITEYSLSEYDAVFISNDKEQALFYQSLLKYTSHSKAAANWLLGPLKYYCNENNISITSFPLSYEIIADLINITESGLVNFNNAGTKILQSLITHPSNTPLQAASGLGVLQESNSAAVEDWVNEVIASMPSKIIEYKNGKKGLLGLFAGEVKKISRGKADMQLVNKILSEKLN